MGEPEGRPIGEPRQTGRGAVDAAVLARRRRDGDLDQREAADGHGRELQGSQQHPGWFLVLVCIKVYQYKLIKK